MKIEQRFTRLGLIGVAFIFFGPACTGYAYWQWVAYMQTLLRMPAYIPPLPGSIVFLSAIGAIASLSSFPLMIIGREFESSQMTFTAGRIEPR